MEGSGSDTNEDVILDDESVETEREEKQEKKLIIFAKFNRYYIILFISPIFCMLANYFIYKVKDKKLNIFKHQYIFNMLNVPIFHAFAGLFYFVSSFRKNSNKGKASEEDLTKVSTIQYIYNEADTIDIKKYIIFLIILSALLINERFLLTYIYDNKRLDPRVFYIILIPLFSKLILKENLYKHQYLSLAICVIGWIILNIPVCLEIRKEDILANFLNLLKGTCYPLSLSIIKYLSDKYYKSPLLTSLIFGTMSIILTLLGFIIYSLIKYHDLSFFNEYDFSQVDDKVRIAFYFILIIVFGTILYLLNLLILFYFSPIFLLITEVISPFLQWIVQTIENNQNTTLQLIINPIGFIIVLFSSLVCNEIIIFNFWGLSKNTRKFVNERMTIEISKVNRLTGNTNNLGS